MRVRRRETVKWSALVGALVVVWAAGCGYVDAGDTTSEGEPTLEEQEGAEREPPTGIGDPGGAPSCEYAADRVVGRVSPGSTRAGPALAVNSEGDPRVAWAIEGRDDALHIARKDRNGWTEATWSPDELYRFDGSYNYELDGLKLASTADADILALQTSNRSPKDRDTNFFSASESEWERIDHLDETNALAGPIRVDRRGRLHALVVHEESDNGDPLSVRLYWGPPGEFESRTLYRTTYFTETAKLVPTSDGEIRAVYRHPEESQRFRWLAAGDSEPFALDGLEGRDDFVEAQDFAFGPRGTFYLLARTEADETDEQGGGVRTARAIFRRTDESWEKFRVAEGMSSSWKDQCPRDGRYGYEELDGETCEVDHTTHAAGYKELLNQNGKVWVAQIRIHREGTARWDCIEDYQGCARPCRLNDDEVNREVTLRLGALGADGVEFAPVEGGDDIALGPVGEQGSLRPYSKMFSTARFGPDGKLHFVYVERTGEENPDRIRYGRVRCR